MYPLVESVPVLALCLFLGLAVMLDLRLLGVSMRSPSVSEFVGRLLPWTAAGFVLMVISGALLFYAIPVRTYQNIFFRLHSSLSPCVVKWRWPMRHASGRCGARLVGVISVALWS